MNFISLTFVFLFPVVVLLYWKIPWKHRELFLLAVSYFFYIRESSWAGGLLLLTTAVTYLVGIAIEKGRHRRTWLIFAVAVCLGLLIGLKYFTISDDGIITFNPEIFSPAGGNLILYFPDNGICDRCISR